MQLTPQDLWMLRNIAIRAISDCHEVLAGAARVAQVDRPNEDAWERSHKNRHEQAPKAQSAPRQAFGEPAPTDKPVAVDKLSYSVREAAAAVGVSTWSIWNYKRLGRLETFKLGNRTLIRAMSLHALIEHAQENEEP